MGVDRYRVAFPVAFRMCVCLCFRVIGSVFAVIALCKFVYVFWLRMHVCLRYGMFDLVVVFGLLQNMSTM